MKQVQTNIFAFFFIPAIPFILVKKAFSTGMKGMAGMLRMALRAAIHASLPPLRGLTPVAVVQRAKPQGSAILHLHQRGAIRARFYCGSSPRCRDPAF